MKHFAKDTVLIKEGTQSSSFYVLMSGSLQVTKEDILLAEYSEPGTVVGEIGAILGTKRTASVRCVSDCEMLEIEGDLSAQIKEFPDIIMYVLENLALRLSATTDGYLLHSNKLAFMKYLLNDDDKSKKAFSSSFAALQSSRSYTRPN